jgi:hypothetical protein
MQLIVSWQFYRSAQHTALFRSLTYYSSRPESNFKNNFTARVQIWSAAKYFISERGKSSMRHPSYARDGYEIKLNWLEKEIKGVLASFR